MTSPVQQPSVQAPNILRGVLLAGPHFAGALVRAWGIGTVRRFLS